MGRELFAVELEFETETEAVETVGLDFRISFPSLHKSSAIGRDSNESERTFTIFPKVFDIYAIPGYSMIDLFAIISLGGLIRWTFTSHKFDHLNLIDNALTTIDVVESSEMAAGNQVIKWFINEELGLIYLLSHPKMFPIPWTQNLFKKMDLFVAKEFSAQLAMDEFYEFDNETITGKFKEIIKREETKLRESKKENVKNKKPVDIKATNTENIRSWNDKISKNDLSALDYSDKTEEKDSKRQLLSVTEKSKIDEASDAESSASDSESKNSWWNSLKALTGNNPLKLEDLQPALKEMKLHLLSKNVASDAAEFVIKSVGNRLEGRVPGTFSSISRMVRDATRETLGKILTPSKPTDLLNEIETKRRSGLTDPFVMAFIGVNGVGKSTNLSKVAYWLLQHNYKLLLVAGDTFRAGAIEQLRHHSRNLANIAPGRIEIYERGYGKDAALIAQDAIKHAKENCFDLVLIDTAGRMQDNGPLMIALAKLINLNRPDRVIFVGEALVGHDALSQLSKFNAALLDHAAKPIDALLLTKVDTIDDKIGAALSMTWIAKAPILFMGVGQTYTDLKRINVKQVVDLLLK